MRRTAALICALLLAAGCGSATREGERAVAGFRLHPPTGGTAPVGATEEASSPATGPESVGAPAAIPSGEQPGGAVTPDAPGKAQARPGAPQRTDPAQSAAPAARAAATTGDVSPAASDGARPARAAASVPPPQKSEIVFGSFGVESGLLSAITAGAAAGVRAWVGDVNSRGGLNGHPVRMIFAEDGGDPGRAQAIVRQMVEQDHIMALFFPYDVGTLDPVLPYLESVGIPVYGGQLDADFKADYSPMVFNLFIGSDKALAWELILNVTTQSDRRNAAVLYCREAVICQHQRDQIKQYLPYDGMRIVYEAQVTQASPDYTAEALSAQRAGADVVLVFLDINSIARFVKSARRQGYAPVVSTAHQVQSDLVLPLAKDLEGLLAGSVTAPYDSPRMADYRMAIARYQPKAVLSGYGAAAYMSGRLLEARIAPTLDDSPTTGEFIEALYALRNETFGGLLPGITFPRDRDRSRVNMCSVPVKLTGGKWLPSTPSFVCTPGWKPS
jgi:branched-chain amino acid transport system substrate-binding protein